jgi:hypothetical protein
MQYRREGRRKEGRKEERGVRKGKVHNERAFET